MPDAKPTPQPQSSVTISTQLLTAVAKWASTERPNISAVRVEKGELFATDGHRMVRVPVPAAHGFEVAVRRSYVLAAAQAQSALSGPDVLTGPEGKSLAISRAGGDVQIVLGTDVRLMVPDGSHRDAPTLARLNSNTPTLAETGSRSPSGYVLNPGYLAAIDEVEFAIHGGTCGTFKRNGVRCVAWATTPAEEKLTSIMFEGESGARYLIMPMRGWGK